MNYVRIKTKKTISLQNKRKQTKEHLAVFGKKYFKSDIYKSHSDLELMSYFSTNCLVILTSSFN